MAYIAVIDTETNWSHQVMSIGTVIADAETFAPAAMKYHILPAECSAGGIYSSALYLDTPVPPVRCTRKEAMEDLCAWLTAHGVTRIFAYNAGFDHSHLPELGEFKWHDIMCLAAYRQHNTCIPDTAECYASGKLKRNYGVEPILQLLSGNCGYRETHNALLDAVDELEIMRRLHCPVCSYPEL